MTIVRRIIAAAAVCTFAVLPISVIATNTQTAAGTVTTNGQGNWPLGR